MRDIDAGAEFWIRGPQFELWLGKEELIVAIYAAYDF